MNSLYPLINKLFPHHETLLAEMIWERDGADVGRVSGEEDEEKSFGKEEPSSIIAPVV
jgi:hypothetical protein